MTKLFWRVVVGLAVMAMLGVADARPMDPFDHAAVMESLSSVHPRQRGRWLSERGLELPGWNTPLPPPGSDSTGLREVGRWSYGPSFDVDGRVTPAETLLALARGSGVSLLRFERTDRVALELLSDINAGGLVNRVRVRDSLLFVGSRKGLETWNIADERNPARLSVLGTALNDFALQDSFAFVISDDSFKAYSIADPARPYRVGACRDSGEVIGVTNNAAFLGDRWGLYVVDLANPAAPHRLTSLGFATECVTARGDYCYITTYNPNQSGDIEFRVLNVADPGTPYQVGMVDQAGGYDIELCDTFAYCSGDGNNINEMTVVSVANPSQPRQVSRANTPGWSMGIWVNGRASSAFVGCHWEGLNVYDVRDPAVPVRDTWLLGADQAVDVHIDNGRAYIANEMAGLKILDITDPTRPTQLSGYDTTGQRPFLTSVAARDSFAFIEWSRPKFRTLDVTNPSQPAFAGTCELFSYPEDMVIRDSFVYCAEANRFQVVNVARPREPRLVGSLTFTGTGRHLDLRDTIAYIAKGSGGLMSVNMANPVDPRHIGSWTGRTSATVTRDTLLYLTAPYTGCVCLNVANPASPRVVDSLHLTDTLWWNDLTLVDSIAYIGGERVWAVDISNPVDLRLVPGVSWTPPYLIQRIEYVAPYFYLACYDAGVCILETTATALAEPSSATDVPRASHVVPNPSRGRVVIDLCDVRSRTASVRVLDITGKEVMHRQVRSNAGRVTLDLRGLPAGVYFVGLDAVPTASKLKVVRHE